MADLFEICGQRKSFSLQEAKRLYKNQWSAKQYVAALDMRVAGRPRISPANMLKILRLRSKYIAERGATLNNPHITKNYLDRFANTSRVVASANWAQGVRQIAKEFVRANPRHPAISWATPPR
jgi:hypothetical protein